MTSSLCIFCTRLLLILLAPNIFLSTLFLDNARLCYINNVRDQVLKYRIFYAIKLEH
jgi:hypothetical protein